MKKVVTIVCLILLQLIWMAIVLFKFSYTYTYVNYGIRLIAVCVVIYMINQWKNLSSKLSWTFLILLSPGFGLLLYLIFGRKNVTKHTAKKMDAYIRLAQKHTYQTPAINRFLKEQDKAVYRQTKYINDWSGYPVYQNTETKYYKSGEDMFPDMLVELEKARHYIFLEYFIVEEGYMFNQILEVLERKAKVGVDVRLIYDDVGSIATLPEQYYETLKSKGIKCAAFNPFHPSLSVLMNNRDHRKIMVADGTVGFTGGINLADEYINQVERYGYWKDTGVRLNGEGVWSLTLMFLSMWDCINEEEEDYEKFRPQENDKKEWASDGVVQPYCDCPLNTEYVCETVYMNIINQAMEYLYIFTPYLIIDNEMLTALCNTAKRGVDVRIVTPGVPDKRMIFWMTQSYYQPLIASGVKIYQYRPGFLHAKSFLCDDKIATVGSVNLDYRSLYLHFECGIYMYRTKAVFELKQDCMEVFATSDEITIEFCKKQSLFIKLLQCVMRLIAPLC